jgi:glutamyl/glutaminyl-tRNA synthetase
MSLSFSAFERDLRKAGANVENAAVADGARTLPPGHDYVCLMADHRTRIAPTPSGYLHAGNAINFLVTADLAQRMGASIRLRIDDLDAGRMRPEYLMDIFESLMWLGISWQDGPRDVREHERHHSQQTRIPRYLEPIELLKEQGDLYACGCSRSELAKCACRVKALPFQHPQVTWRMHLPSDALVRLRGLNGESTTLHPSRLMPDPVLRQRAELGGRPAYQIASLIDDAEHGIDLVVRGEDLLPSTACQLYLAERLGLGRFASACFVHHALITDEEGRKLSKSAGSASLLAMRARGETPEGLKVRAREVLRSL